MRPTIVEVIWSESGAWPDGHVCEFREFEFKALSVAMRHKTGGYLKTKVCVHFDSGDTYTCRLDLAAHDTHGFQHHIEHTLAFMASAGGQKKLAGWPEDFRNSYIALAKVQAQMDFSPEPEPPPAPAEECLPHGIQLLIPGVAPISRPAKRGGDDRQAALF